MPEEAPKAGVKELLPPSPLSPGHIPISARLSFPGGSEDKASAYNAGDPGLSPGLGRFPGEGNGNPLQYSCLENPRERGTWWAAVYGVAQSRLVVQMVKNPPAMRETWVPSLGWEDSLEKGMAIHSSILAWRIP